MNYKIGITEENRAIVKRIADENGMNPNNLDFSMFGFYYPILNNLFYTPALIESICTELTTEKFIEMFDKKETLTYTEAAKKEERITNAEIIKSMNNPTEERKIIAYKAPFDFVWGGVKKGDIAIRDEFQPYVYNVGISARVAMEIVETWEPVFEALPIEQPTESLKKAAEYTYPIGDVWNEEEAIVRRTAFINGAKWETEQPKETDFKTKVIELIDDIILERTENIANNLKGEYYGLAHTNKQKRKEAQYILNQIKQL
jgi:hypothetical protein